MRATPLTPICVRAARRGESPCRCFDASTSPISNSTISWTFDPAAIQAILDLGIPFDVYVHDYVWICPQITFIDGTKGYSRAGDRVVEACVAANGSQLGEAISVANQRRRSAAWLEKARRVIVPSVDAANRFRRYFPQIEFSVTPWETPPLPAKAPRPPDGPVRVALIGAIGDHKGYQQLAACARDAAERKLPLEFVVIGYTQDDEALFATGKVFVTGHYEETEINALLGPERPHIAFFPTVAPETWCYTLTYALNAGLPIVAFDQGAVAAAIAREQMRHTDFLLSLPAPRSTTSCSGRRGRSGRPTATPGVAPRDATEPAGICRFITYCDHAPVTQLEPLTMDNAIPPTLEPTRVARGDGPTRRCHARPLFLCCARRIPEPSARHQWPRACRRCMSG